MLITDSIRYFIRLLYRAVVIVFFSSVVAFRGIYSVQWSILIAFFSWAGCFQVTSRFLIRYISISFFICIALVLFLFFWPLSLLMPNININKSLKLAIFRLRWVTAKGKNSFLSYEAIKQILWQNTVKWNRWIVINSEKAFKSAFHETTKTMRKHLKFVVCPLYCIEV